MRLYSYFLQEYLRQGFVSCRRWTLGEYLLKKIFPEWKVAYMTLRGEEYVIFTPPSQSKTK